MKATRTTKTLSPLVHLSLPSLRFYRVVRTMPVVCWSCESAVRQSVWGTQIFQWPVRERTRRRIERSRPLRRTDRACFTMTARLHLGLHFFSCVNDCSSSKRSIDRSLGGVSGDRSGVDRVSAPNAPLHADPPFMLVPLPASQPPAACCTQTRRGYANKWPPGLRARVCA